jgi:hypothetical protein
MLDQLFRVLLPVAWAINCQVIAFDGLHFGEQAQGGDLKVLAARRAIDLGLTDWRSATAGRSHLRTATFAFL